MFHKSVFLFFLRVPPPNKRQVLLLISRLFGAVGLYVSTPHAVSTSVTTALRGLHCYPSRWHK